MSRWTFSREYICWQLFFFHSSCLRSTLPKCFCKYSFSICYETFIACCGLSCLQNLLVTSTITQCTDPYPAAHGLPCSECTQITENSGPADVGSESTPEHTTAVPNGTEDVAGDGDEEMADVEAEESSGSHDVEMQEDKPDQVDNVNSDANPGAVGAPGAVSASESSSHPPSFQCSCPFSILHVAQTLGICSPRTTTKGMWIQKFTGLS